MYDYYFRVIDKKQEVANITDIEVCYWLQTCIRLSLFVMTT